MTETAEQELFNNTDKQLVIKYCIDHINNGNDGGNGYCNLHYAAINACPNKTFKDPGHMGAFLKSVSSLIIQSGQHKISKEYNSGSADIIKNPDYKRKKYFERHPTQEKLFLALVSAILAGSITFGIAKYNNKSQQKIDSQQNEEIKQLKELINKQRNATNLEK